MQEKLKDWLSKEELNKLLTEDVMENCIEKCDSPNKEDIFNAFIGLSPEDARVLIIGQDPYPNPKKAHGLAFSCKSGRAASLTKIFKALDICFEQKNKKHNYNLTEWAKENKVLLLNTALTFEKSKLYEGRKKKDLTKEQQKKLENDQNRLLDKHLQAWEPFILVVLRKLFEANKNVQVFLWGDKALKLFEKCKNSKGIKTYTTCNPQARQNCDKDFIRDTIKHFKECDNFLGEDIWKKL
ncbi:MAG: hypothetical protein NC311_15000 [Muribaculaceae bacterium]|nr:hypothetical protein [Muribaculaceae bacterium]